MKALSLALALVMAGLSGCATTSIDRARSSVTIGVGVFSAGVESLDKVDAAKQADLIAQYRAGKLSLEDAKAQYAAFSAKFDVAVKAVMALWDAIKTTVSVINAADAKLGGDVAGALAHLTAALAQAVQALHDVGVKIPGVD